MDRLLIVKVVRTDATRADLYGKGHRWPDLKLFDLGELEAVGIDSASLPQGQEVPCRFWALYTLSEKMNKEGNPYKDVVALERVDQPATSSSTDTSEILAELQAIRAELTATRALVRALVLDRGLDIEIEDILEPSPLDEAFPRYQDGSTLGDNPAEASAFKAYQAINGHAPSNLGALRVWYAKNEKDVKR